MVRVLGCLMVSVMSKGSNSAHSRELILKNFGGFSPVVTGIVGGSLRILKLRKTACPSKPEPGTSETWLLFPVPLPGCGPHHHRFLT